LQNVSGRFAISRGVQNDGAASRKLKIKKAPLLKGAVSLKADWRIHPA
jgi:hypothetical protein